MNQREAAAQELLSRRAAARSLHEFVKQAWPWVEGNKPFVDGWHLQAMAEHLTALKNGEIRRLLINIPPRCNKSGMVSVMLPAWWWITNPEEQFLYVSYAMNLSMRDSVKCRRIIESSWYQARWGHIFQLAGDQSTKIRFDNTSLGYRLSTSVDGTLTGEGGGVLVCDDPNNVRDNSDTMLDSAIEWFTQVFSSRMNDPKTGKMIVIQQRCSEKDISGHILANDKANWTHLCLPLEYEPDRKCITFLGNKKWQDPRTKFGELLWPERMGQKEVKQLKKDLASEYAIAGQLQQRPAPSEGGIIKRGWFKMWPAKKPLPEFEYILDSYDTAFTEKTTNDPTAKGTWGIFKYEGKWCALLLDCWTKFLEYPQLRKQVVDEYGSMYGDPPRAVDLILIEDKGSGIALRRDLQQAGLPVRAYNPGKADKIQRAHMTSHLLEAGLVWILESDDPDRKGMPRDWVEPFLNEIVMFPNGRRDDQVDQMTGALWILKDMKLIATAPVHTEIDEDDFKESWEIDGRNPYAL